MLKRLMTLVLFIVIGVVLSQHLDISGSWQKAQAFLEEAPEGAMLENFLIKTKEGKLEHEKEYLEKKLQQLKEDLSETAGAGTRRFENVQLSVLKTANALEETKQVLANLQRSTQASVEVLKNLGEGEPAPELSTQTNTYYQTIVRTIPKAEIESFCRDFSN